MALFGRMMRTTVLDDLRQMAKPFEIPKRILWEAWKRVAANNGAPGVNRESIQSFEGNLGPNLYKLWNRMSSGSYYPNVINLSRRP